ncbi:MAG: hypothetical protein VX906_05130, partial [Candidatus Thermoplasmatota archaeon]|nr:hypothetical protein [Candidatus Thermoplasmatota archaeon]
VSSVVSITIGEITAKFTEKSSKPTIPKATALAFIFVAPSYSRHKQCGIEDTAFSEYSKVESLSK